MITSLTPQHNDYLNTLTHDEHLKHLMAFNLNLCTQVLWVIVVVVVFGGARWVRVVVIVVVVVFIGGVRWVRVVVVGVIVLY